MRAVVYHRYGGPERLELAEVPVPEPASGQVRVRVLACAVNLSDWEYLVGRPLYARLVGGIVRPKQQVLGSDIVGIVDALGPGVDGFQVGDRVTGDFVMIRGGFAEYACVPAKELVEVPDALSDEIAACLPQAGGIAVAGTEGLEPGTRLLINGAGGGSGTMALQLAKAAGAHVTAVDNAGKIEWIRSLGADAVIDYGKFDFADMDQQWDVILDMVATRPARQIAEALVPGGRYRATGGDVGVLLNLVLMGRIWAFRKSIGMLMVPAGRDLTKRVLDLAVTGTLHPHLEDVLPLEAVPDALQHTGTGQVKGKLVIRP